LPPKGITRAKRIARPRSTTLRYLKRLLRRRQRYAEKRAAQTGEPTKRKGFIVLDYLIA